MRAVCRVVFASRLSQQSLVFAVGWAVPSSLRYLSSYSTEESGGSPNLGMEVAVRAAVGLHERPQGPAAEAFPSRRVDTTAGRCSDDFSNRGLIIAINPLLTCRRAWQTQPRSRALLRYAGHKYSAEMSQRADFFLLPCSCPVPRQEV